MSGGGYITVEYKAPGGKVKEALHGFQVGDSSVFTTFTESDWIAIGGGRFLTEDIDAITDPAGDGSHPLTLCEAILGYHRYMHGAHIVITGLRAHDGPTPGAPEGAHAGVELNLQCRGVGLPELPGTQNNVTMGPGNSGVLVDKTSGQFSGQSGRNWLRYAGQRDHSQTGDDDGIECIPAYRYIYQARVAAAVSADAWPGLGGNGLDQYFGAGSPALEGTVPDPEPMVAYVICKTIGAPYVRPDGSQGERRMLVGAWSCAGFSFNDFQSHDNKRQGKRR